MSIDTKDVVLAGLGIGGMFWMNRKLDGERRARIAAEQERDCARACATRPARPSNGLRASVARPALGRLAPHTFDRIFAAHGHGIPVPYLRALALGESNMNPRASSGPALGLLQVIDIVRQDYNQRTGSTYTRQDLLDPVINVRIATSALATIVHSYATNHPRVRNLQPDWRNPRFIELLTFGWNAGWSERGGVGRVAKYLEQRGAFDQTIDTIHQAARAAGASPHLSNPAKVAWCKRVAAQYARELAAEPPTHEHVIEMPPMYVGRPPIVMTGPITQPSQVMTSGPITSPSQVSTPAPTTPVGAVVATAPAPASAPTITVPAGTTSIAPSPSGLAGPINPYDDCTCA